MARRKQRKPGISLREATDPEGLAAWMLRYLEDLRVRNYAEVTVERREEYLKLFLYWCQERGLTRPVEISRAILERYQRHLYYLRKADGMPLSFRSQVNRLLPLRAFFQWLSKRRAILYNPAGELELPRVERRLPKAVLSEEEAERVLGQVDLTEPLGIRDRAILETFYSTGMRRMEVAQLRLFDLDPERGTVMVRQGKGKKDRMIPIGERAIAWTEKYLREVRPELVVPPDEGTLFLTHRGEAFTPDRLTQMVGRYVDAAELGKRGACHLWRHTMSVIMLENGADIRFIQEMLGHAELTTTQIYTQVAIKKLKEIHTATHPTSKLERPVVEELRDGTSGGPDG